jgi:L-lactate dehydrogenase complex protein LldF
MKVAAAALATPRRLSLAQWGAGLVGRLSRGGVLRRLPGPMARWSDTRDTPAPPRESFRAWWRRERNGR